MAFRRRGSGTSSGKGGGSPLRIERVTFQPIGTRDATGRADTAFEGTPLSSSAFSVVEPAGGDVELFSALSSNDFTVAAGTYELYSRATINIDASPSEDDASIFWEVRRASDNSILASSTRSAIDDTGDERVVNTALLHLAADTSVNIYVYRLGEASSFPVQWHIEFIRWGGRDGVDGDPGSHGEAKFPEWVAGVHAVGNAVRHGVGRYYVCLVARTAADRTGPDADHVGWKEITVFRGAWARGYFSAGQIVTHSGGWYIANQNVQNDVAAPDANNKWTRFDGAGSAIDVSGKADQTALDREIQNRADGDAALGTRIDNLPSAPSALTDAEIGDKAFSNPPGDLSDAEKLAVRTAIGDPDPAAGSAFEFALDNVAEVMALQNRIVGISDATVTRLAGSGEAPITLDTAANTFTIRPGVFVYTIAGDARPDANAAAGVFVNALPDGTMLQHSPVVNAPTQNVWAEFSITGLYAISASVTGQIRFAALRRNVAVRNLKVTLAEIGGGTGGGETPAGDHNRLIGWSAARVPTAAEILAATIVDDSNILTIPSRTAGQDAHIFFGVVADPGLPDELYFSNNPSLNQIAFWGERSEANAGDFTRAGDTYLVMSTDNELFAATYGDSNNPVTMRMVYTS